MALLIIYHNYKPVISLSQRTVWTQTRETKMYKFNGMMSPFWNGSKDYSQLWTQPLIACIVMNTDFQHVTVKSVTIIEMHFETV